MTEAEFMAVVCEVRRIDDLSYLDIPLDAAPFDSLDLLELRALLETHLALPLTDEKFNSASTLRDLYFGGQQMSDTVIHLPQTDATGLSENWLFKHCGERHWDYLCAAIGVSGVNAKEMRDDAGNRLYPTFLAIRGRYATPLCKVQMDQHFHTTVTLKHFGRAFFHSTIAFRNEETRFDLEMLTTFVARCRHGLNDLRQSMPSADLVYNSWPLSSPPWLLKLNQRLRHADIADYDFVGYQFSRAEPDLNLQLSFEPSPYIDYNGAGLLYFAAYPTIADTLERRLIIRHELMDEACDWAERTSTVARDVFYYRNLNLGQRLTATLRRFDRVGDNVILHTALTAERDGAALADIFTAKRVVHLIRS